MKYSVSNWIFGKEPLERGIERIARLGYDAVELKGEPEELKRANVYQVLDKYNVRVSSICGMYPWPTDSRDLSSDRREVRDAAVRYVKECIDFARSLSAAVVIVSPSPVAKLNPSSDKKTDWKNAVESVKRIAEHTEKQNVLIGIEAINRYEVYLVSTAEDALKFIDEVNSSNVKVMLDCFHMNIEESDLGSAIRKVGPELINLHITDSNRRAVGKGHIDFKSVMRALKDINYSYYLTMEPLPSVSDPYIAMNTQLPGKIHDNILTECIELLQMYERVIE